MVWNYVRCAQFNFYFPRNQTEMWFFMANFLYMRLISNECELRLSDNRFVNCIQKSNYTLLHYIIKISRQIDKLFKVRVYTITKLLKFIICYQFSFVKTTRKFIIVKFLIRKLGSSSMLIVLIMIRIQTVAIIKLRGVSTKLNWYHFHHIIINYYTILYYTILHTVICW